MAEANDAGQCKDDNRGGYYQKHTIAPGISLASNVSSNSRDSLIYSNSALGNVLHG